MGGREKISISNDTYMGRSTREGSGCVKGCGTHGKSSSSLVGKNKLGIKNRDFFKMLEADPLLRTRAKKVKLLTRKKGWGFRQQIKRGEKKPPKKLSQKTKIPSVHSEARVCRREGR